MSHFATTAESDPEAELAYLAYVPATNIIAITVTSNANAINFNVLF